MKDRGLRCHDPDSKESSNDPFLELNDGRAELGIDEEFGSSALGDRIHLNHEYDETLNSFRQHIHVRRYIGQISFVGPRKRKGAPIVTVVKC